PRAARTDDANLSASRLQTNACALRRGALNDALSTRPRRDRSDRSIAITEPELQFMIDRTCLRVERAIKTIVLLRPLRDVLVIRRVIDETGITPAHDIHAALRLESESAVDLRQKAGEEETRTELLRVLELVESRRSALIEAGFRQTRWTGVSA